MTPRTAVIIVNFGSIGLVRSNATHLRISDGQRVIVVDSFSSLNERHAVDLMCRERGWTPVLLDTNAGFGGGMNAGVSRAVELGADVIVALNPDATITQRALEALAAAARAGSTSLVSPRIIDGSGNTWFGGSDLYLDDGSIASVARRSSRTGRPRHSWATGACFALSVEMWQRIRGFDEEYFLYWEDVDLSRKVLDAGGDLRIVDAVAVHDEGQTHSEGRSGASKSETYYYYNIRNRLLYARKHGGQDLQRRWRRAALRVSWGIVMQGGRRQMLTSLAPWRALVRGLSDARRQRWGARRD